MALSDSGRVIGVCKQERINRVREAGFTANGLPEDALDALLERGSHRRDAVGRFVSAEPLPTLARSHNYSRLDHELAHAATAYLSSPYTAATVIVCDEDGLSVWSGSGGTLSRIEWPWSGPGLTHLYSECARLLGFVTQGAEQRFEALARLYADTRHDGLSALWSTDGHQLMLHPQWQAACEQLVDRSTAMPGAARLAAAMQNRISDLTVEIVGAVRRVAHTDALCLGGSLFYHSAINTAVARSGHFDKVFVPIDPGDAGLSVGCALHADGETPHAISPFLGPSYTAEEIKATLDNCKLRYDWGNEDHVIDTAVDALRAGRMVGWFEGAMEWGPRALGARCILANPFAPYALENLNQFLKHREPWRGYALTGTAEAVRAHFDGPADAPFMEYDYRPHDTALFERVLPSPSAAMRVQTLDAGAPPRFTRLIEAFGAATGLPFLVNTSFNGFREPIVCSPRDAVRVFFGTGLDVMIAEQFVLEK